MKWKKGEGTEMGSSVTVLSVLILTVLNAIDFPAPEWEVVFLFRPELIKVIFETEIDSKVTELALE